MAPDNRKPPGAGRLSWNPVAADDFNVLRDNPKAPKNQAATQGLFPIGKFADRIVRRLGQHFRLIEGAGS